MSSKCPCCNQIIPYGGTGSSGHYQGLPVVGMEAELEAQYNKLKDAHDKEIEKLDERYRYIMYKAVKEAEKRTHELCNAIKTINRNKYHEIKVNGDDEVCYWQRKEWVDWIYELASKDE